MLDVGKREGGMLSVVVMRLLRMGVGRLRCETVTVLVVVLVWLVGMVVVVGWDRMLMVVVVVVE
jgi:hypothetical protein